MRPESVFRFDLYFKIPESNPDPFIGRAAQFQFMECQPIMKMIYSITAVSSGRSSRRCFSGTSVVLHPHLSEAGG